MRLGYGPALIIHSYIDIIDTLSMSSVINSNADLDFEAVSQTISIAINLKVLSLLGCHATHESCTCGHPRRSTLFLSTISRTPHLTTQDFLSEDHSVFRSGFGWFSHSHAALDHDFDTGSFTRYSEAPQGFSTT